MTTMDNPETFRAYASIFEKAKRDVRGGPLLPATEPCAAAAKALRFMADAIEASMPREGGYSIGVKE